MTSRARASPTSLNLGNVYQRCGAPICVVETRFLATREGAAAMMVEFTGDAIVNRESAFRRWDLVDEEGASLSFVFDEAEPLE